MVYNVTIILTVVKFNKFDNCSVGIAPRYGIKFQWGARFSAPVQTGYEAHPASYTMGTGFFSGVKRPGRGINHPTHLAPRLMEE